LSCHLTLHVMGCLSNKRLRIVAKRALIALNLCV
jgi:hypothetical protein